uniref:ADF-H domain-containing protein n=1 Tax=Hucho hucho TaxID=62062 RepID=A0A4W5QK98_9TELE
MKTHRCCPAPDSELPAFMESRHSQIRGSGDDQGCSVDKALFTYDGVTNNLKLADSGAGGVVELSGKFHIARPLYGLCRAGSAETGGPRVAMICWVGPNVDEFRRTECASHVPAIKAFFNCTSYCIGWSGPVVGWAHTQAGVHSS